MGTRGSTVVAYQIKDDMKLAIFKSKKNGLYFRWHYDLRGENPGLYADVDLSDSGPNPWYRQLPDFFKPNVTIKEIRKSCIFHDHQESEVEKIIVKMECSSNGKARA